MTFPVLSQIPRVQTTAALTATAVINAGTTIYTFTGLSTGTADGNRWIVAAPFVFNSPTTTFSISSLTVSGSTATRVASILGTRTLGHILTELWVYPLAEGTTSDIVVTVSTSSGAGTGMTLWRLISCTPATMPVAIATTENTSPVSLTVGAENGAVVIGSAGGIGVGSVSVTWTGLLERADFTVNTSGRASSGAVGVATSTTLTATATFSVADRDTLILGAWR